VTIVQEKDIDDCVSLDSRNAIWMGLVCTILLWMYVEIHPFHTVDGRGRKKSKLICFGCFSRGQTSNRRMACRCSWWSRRGLLSL
jgi:hypothetical protein